MTVEMVVVLGVIVGALALWISEWLPVDLVALCVPVVLVVAGVLEPDEAVAGFASPALVTVAAILVVSAGLLRTGAVAFVGNKIIHLARGSEIRLLVLVMVTMAAFSAFINNTAIVAVFLPIMLGVAQKFDLPPSRLLIPLSFASILGGTCSLIGTSTNVLVHGLMQQYGLAGLGMFEMTPVGVAYATLGIGYLLLFGPRLLPDRGTVTSYLQTSRGATEYMTEVQVPEGSPLAGRQVGAAMRQAHPEVRLLQVIRGEQILWPPLDDVVIRAKDVFLLKGDVNDLLNVYQTEGLELLPGLKAEAARYAVKDMALAEIVVMPNSRLIGRTLVELDFRKRYGASVMALQRHGEHLREKLPSIRLRIGDILLVMADREDIRRLMSFEEFLVLEGVQEVVVRKDKAPIALALVGILVVLGSFGLSVMVVAMAVAVAMVGTGCIRMREAHAALDLSVLLLIGGVISLQRAMEVTGTAELLAGLVLEAFGGYGPWVVLSMIYLLTSLCTEAMSNTAAAVLMVPVAIGAAQGLGVDPRPFAIAVAFAGSASFTTPIGYQTNTLVYGPGGYRFSDFVKIGLPLNIILWLAASLLIPLWWPPVAVQLQEAAPLGVAQELLGSVEVGAEHVEADLAQAPEVDRLGVILQRLYRAGYALGLETPLDELRLGLGGDGAQQDPLLVVAGHGSGWYASAARLASRRPGFYT